MLGALTPISVNHILVTGGAGFIGSHVAQALLAQGREVTVLDNYDPFYDPRLKRENVSELFASGTSRFRFEEGDLRDERACARVVDGVDGIIHLAALAGVRPSIERPADYMDVNVVGTQRLLDAVRNRPLPIVFGSSSSVYGGNPKVPFAEEDPVDEPVSPYAASKKAGEVLCHAFHHLHGHPIHCLRFFTVYGPRQRPEMAIHKFARKISAGEPLPFFGDGSSRRDYTFVTDIVDGVLRALDHAASTGAFRVYNLGGSATTSLADLVAHLEDALGQKAILDRQPDQPGDVPQTWADPTRARAELGWSAKVQVEQGIRRFCQWYCDERSRGSIQ